MDWTTIVNYIGAFITVVSICVNVIQYIKKTDDQKVLRSQVQMQYNYHYLVARVVTRIRHIHTDKTISRQDSQNMIMNEVNIIRGVSDAARNNLIAFSRESLNFIPFFEHPAIPGKEPTDAVKFGVAPEDTLDMNKEKPA